MTIDVETKHPDFSRDQTTKHLTYSGRKSGRVGAGRTKLSGGKTVYHKKKGKARYLLSEKNKILRELRQTKTRAKRDRRRPSILPVEYVGRMLPSTAVVHGTP